VTKDQKNMNDYRHVLTKRNIVSNIVNLCFIVDLMCAVESHVYLVTILGSSRS